MTIEIGASAPEFTLPGNQNQMISLTALRGKWIVLYFYPKDLTSGCTLEAESFRDLHNAFSVANAVILGVSKDTVRKHDQFVCKHDLPFTLVSDESSDLCERYGVWVKKSMYGRSYMGIERSTFLIDPTGIITHIWKKVKVPGHAAEVLKYITNNNTTS